MPRGGLARLNPDGSLDPNFNNGAGFDSVVVCMARQLDGEIVVGGSFTTLNGQSQPHIARIDSLGNPDGPTSFVTFTDNDVDAVLVQPDGEIIIGGDFTAVNNIAANHLARLDTSGFLEAGPSFNIGTGADGGVFCIALQADGRILIGGDFQTFNGIGPSGITRLNSDGTNDTNFLLSAGIGVKGELVNSIALQAEGSIIYAGQFTTVSGENHPGIARLSGVDGSVDSSFDTGSGTTAFITSVALQADGSVLVTGDFTSFNSVKRSGLVRLHNDFAQHTIIPDYTVLEWLRLGSSPELEQVTFELSTNGGATYSLLGSASRISNGWELSLGSELPTFGVLRARGMSSGGFDNGSAGLIEDILVYTLPATQLGLSLTSSNLTQFPNVDVTFSLSVSAPGTPSLTYMLDFGDGNPVLSGSIANGATLTFTHPFLASPGYNVTATVSDGTNMVSQSVTEIIPAPNSGGAGVTNVSDPTPVVNPVNNFSMALTNSDGGLVQITNNIDNLTAADVRSLYFVNTDFGDVAGRSSIEPGLTPVHKYIQHGLFIAQAIATNQADGSFAGHARKTLTISAKETGETGLFVRSSANGPRTLGDVSPTITTKTMKGKFVFNQLKPDSVLYSGTITLPSGLNTGATHEFSIAIGNIVANTMLDTKGNGKSLTGNKLVTKLKVTYLKVKKGAITTTGQMASISATFTLAGLVAGGFDTEGISPKGLVPGSKTMVDRSIQLAMLLDGVPYEAKVPVGFAIDKTSDFGTMVGRSGP